MGVAYSSPRSSFSPISDCICLLFPCPPSGTGVSCGCLGPRVSDGPGTDSFASGCGIFLPFFLLLDESICLSLTCLNGPCVFCSCLGVVIIGFSRTDSVPVGCGTGVLRDDHPMFLFLSDGTGVLRDDLWSDV